MQLTAPRAIAILGVSLLWACNAVLGVKDLGDTQSDAGLGSQNLPNTPDGGSPSSENDGGRAGTASASSGATASGGGGGRSGSAGMVSPGSSSGGQGGAGGRRALDAAGSGGETPAAPDGGRGGVPAAANGGSGGAAAASGGAIHGRILDSRRRPLPNVSVRSGDRTSLSDVSGAFSLDDLPAEYDLVLEISYINFSSESGHRTWLFQGLTRRDPTLQVYDGLNAQATDLIADVQNITFPVAADQTVYGAFGSPDADFSMVITQPMEDFSNAYWNGPASIGGVVHGLRVGIDPATQLPLSYLAHAEAPVTLVSSQDHSVALNLGGTSLSTGLVSGTVTGAAGRSRENWIQILWNDGALLSVAFDETTSTDAFSYLVPSLPNSRIGVIGLAGSTRTPPFALAYIDDAAPGQSGINLALPNAVAPVAPEAAKTALDGTTLFQWNGEDNVYVLAAYSDNSDEGLYVVTSKRQAKLPIAPFAQYVPKSNTSFEWHVETHGKFASVDEATADAGLIGTFFEFGLRGPKRGPGSYTESEHRKFTTPP